MTNVKIALAAATAFAIVVPAATTANAQPGEVHFVRHSSVYVPGIDRRINRQRKRIRHAKRDGALTWWQARRLRRRLANIRGELRFASMDGKVTRYERRYLHQILDRNSRRIERLSKNYPVRLRRRLWKDIRF